MSQEISSTIKIIDGFSEPLTDLAKQLTTCDNLATALVKTFKEQMEVFSKSTDEIIEHVAAYAEYLIPNLDIVDSNLARIDKSFGKIAKASKKAFDKSDKSITKIKEATVNSAKYIGRSIGQTFKPLTESFKAVGLNAKVASSVIKDEFSGLKNAVYANMKAATVDGKIVWGDFIKNMKIGFPAAMKSSFSEVQSTIKSGTRLSASQIKEGMLRSIDGFKGPAGLGAKMKLAFKNPMNAINEEMPALQKNFGNTINKVGKETKKIGKELGKIKQSLLSDVFGNVVAIGTEKMAMGAFNKLKDSYVRVFGALQRSIDVSIDDIAVSEKLEAMYGEAGKYAKERAFELANEIGESTAMVADLSAQAAYQGIGQDSFERIVGLADKISSVKPGETFENIASSLISNIKSGHDAGSIAQLYGGGQVMENQLRRAGYERALNRGDIQGALDIAEKIAEQAGLTQERYEDAYSNMSQNYQRIFNIIDNVKKRFAETFNRSFAPTIQKIKNLLTSDTFKKIIDYLDIAVSLVGRIANFITEKMVDNIKVLGILLGVGILAKTFLLVKRLRMIIGTVKFIKDMMFLFKGPFGFIFAGLRKVIAHLVAIGVKQSLILIKNKALSVLKVAGPWMILGAAMAAALKILHHFFGQGKSFKDFCMGFLGAVVQGVQNVAYNVAVFFGRLFDKIKVAKLSIHGLILAVKKWIYENIGGVIDWIIDKLFGPGSPLSSLLELFDVDTSTFTNSAKEMVSGLISETTSKIDEIAQEIANIEGNQMEYIDFSKGMKEAYESNGENVKQLVNMAKDGISGLLGVNKKQEEKQAKIQDDASKIRRQGEQEEELRWLKAFSDRQITSSYSSMTSNVRNLTINGMSQTGMTEFGRRNLSSMPTRAAM